MFSLIPECIEQINNGNRRIGVSVREIVTLEKLKLLADAIEKSISLKSINLENNQITDEGAKVLAVVIEKSVSLQNIYLSSNQITDEGAKALAAASEKSVSLQTIILGWNQITDEGAKALAAAIEKSVSLQNINLTRNQITDNNLCERSVKSAVVRRAVMALMGYDCAITKYDGDNAIMTRVLKFMLITN